MCGDSIIRPAMKGRAGSHTRRVATLLHVRYSRLNPRGAFSRRFIRSTLGR